MDDLTPRERIATLRDVAERLKAKACRERDAELNAMAERVEENLRAAMSLADEKAEA